LAGLSIGSAEGRGFSRALLGGATEIDVDASGRMLVPDHLKSYAGLATKVVVAGISNRVELWNEESWNQYTSGVENEANVLAQKLSDIGMI
jgi:transcriptional regulator MraZ